MHKIIKIEGTSVWIGAEDGSIIKTPIATINFANPKVGDEVDIYKDGETTIVMPKAPAKSTMNASSIYSESGNEKKIEKHLYVWVGTFLLGSLGVDRFLRGQIPLGVIKLIT